jgi:hypothetical protein
MQRSDGLATLMIANEIAMMMPYCVATAMSPWTGDSR